MNYPIRVLHVLHSLNCGGTENMIMNLYRNIDKNKIQFDFLVHTKEKCFFDDEVKELGGNIYRVPYYNLLNEYSYVKSLNEFFKNHREIKIVHGHLGSCAHIYLKIAKKYGCYVIAHAHISKPDKITAKNLLYKLFSIKTRGVADFFFACSIQAGKYHYGKKIINSERFKMLNNAIDINKYGVNAEQCEKIKQRYDITDKYVMGHIGRFNSVKNHKFLLDVFGETLKIQPNSVLMLVGGGELFEDIKTYAGTLGIGDKVIFTGVTQDVNQYLQVMDCFVFPSLYEGLGIVAIEAECLGIPCFINNTLPSELYINENVFGLSLNKSAKEWAEFIVRNSNKKIPEQIAKEKISNAGYDINATAKQLEEFYYNVTE